MELNEESIDLLELRQATISKYRLGSAHSPREWSAHYTPHPDLMNENPLMDSRPSIFNNDHYYSSQNQVQSIEISEGDVS